MSLKHAVTTDEISELGRAFDSTGRRANTGSRTVRPYDFTRPDKITKSKLQALEQTFADLGRKWAETMSVLLGSEVSAQVTSVERAASEAYAQTIPETSIVSVAETADLKCAACMDVPSELALRIVNRLAGGKRDISFEPRSLTPIELEIAKRFLDRLFADLSDACGRSKAVQFRISGVHQSFRDTGFDDREMLVVACMVMNVRGLEHRVNVVVQAGLLDTLVDATEPHRGVRNRVPSAGVNRQAVESMLGPVPVEMAADLGCARVTLQDLLNMGIGDVIKLDHSANEPVSLRIGKQPAFQSHPGLSGNRLSVRIKDRIVEPDVRTDVEAQVGTSQATIEEHK